jgi:hypothetical protein
LFTSDVLAVTVTYWAFLGCFAWELGAFKAKSDLFCEGAVADLTKPVFLCDAATASVWAGAFGHFWAFFAGNSAHTNFHF